MNGAVGTDDDTPISVSGPLRRKKRKHKRRFCAGAVAAHIFFPFGHLFFRRANIGIVIARHDRDVVRRADTGKPRTRLREFVGQREIDEVAGDRDVVGPLRPDIGNHSVQHIAPVEGLPAALPVQIAERALARELTQP